MRAGDTARLLRWSRWGILSTAILLGSAMMLSASSNHSRIHSISQTLILGQGQLLVAGVRQALFALGPRAESEDLTRVLASFEEQGMRYVALPLPTVREAGTAMGGLPEVVPVRPGEPPELLVSEVGNRVRLVWRAPPPNPRGPPAG
ncbi:MAG TPA: hypothetical protein VF815_07310, partial [Myxococcaceae bacterium]